MAEVLVGRASNTPRFFGSQFHPPQRMRPEAWRSVYGSSLLTARALQSPLITGSCSHPGPSCPVTVLTPRPIGRPVALDGEGAVAHPWWVGGRPGGVAMQLLCLPQASAAVWKPHVNKHRQLLVPGEPLGNFGKYSERLIPLSLSRVLISPEREGERAGAGGR